MRKLQLTRTPASVFTAALFITDGVPKRPRCPSTDEWIEKPQYINTAYKKECIGLSSNRMDEPRGYYTE